MLEDVKDSAVSSVSLEPSVIRCRRSLKQGLWLVSRLPGSNSAPEGSFAPQHVLISAERQGFYPKGAFLPPPRRLCFHLRLSICPLNTQKLQMDNYETWWTNAVWVRKEPITFWWRSGSGGGWDVFYSRGEDGHLQKCWWRNLRMSMFPQWGQNITHLLPTSLALMFYTFF